MARTPVHGRVLHTLALVLCSMTIAAHTAHAQTPTHALANSANHAQTDTDSRALHASATLQPHLQHHRFTTFLPQLSLELGAQRGFFTPSRSFTSKDTRLVTRLVTRPASPTLQSTHTSVLSTWDTPYLHIDAALSLAYAATRGDRDTRPLSLLRISTHRGPLSLSLGLEQSMGVTTDLSVTGGDTASYNPADTMLTHGSSDTIAPYTPQTPSPRITTVTAALIRASDVVAGFGWNTGYSSLQFLTGLRTNDTRARTWTGLDATLYLGASNALTFSARRQPRAAAISSPVFTLGFRSNYWHWGHSIPVDATTDAHPRNTSSVTHPVRVTTVGDTTSLEIYLPTAHRAAIMGDATDWTSVEMTQTTEGWWHAALHITTPLSRIQLKTDNTEWRPIPGLPATRDEYGGTASLLDVIPTTPVPSEPVTSDANAPVTAPSHSSTAP